MQTVAKLLILVGFGATLSGCVVAPYGPRPRAYVLWAALLLRPPLLMAGYSGWIHIRPTRPPTNRSRPHPLGISMRNGG